MSGPDPELARALVRWQRAAGPYWPYVCAAPFLAEFSVAVPVRSGRPVDALGSAIERIGPDERPALFVDLPPVGTLRSAPALADRGFFVVAVIQRWPAPSAVLDCRDVVRVLVASGALLRRPREPRGVVFLLDGGRAGSVEPGGARPRRAFDNRYGYRADRFPPPEFLRRAGVSVIRWIGAGGIASDLLPYARGLAEAGFTLQVEPARH